MMIQSLKKAARFKKPATVGSDAHSLNMIGYSINIIDASDADSIFKQIKKGKIEFQSRYVPLQMIVQWAKERFVRSYDEVVKYIYNNYSFPRAKISMILLNRFIESKREFFWDALAGIGLGISKIYGIFALMNYLLV